MFLMKLSKILMKNAKLRKCVMISISFFAIYILTGCGSTSSQIDDEYREIIVERDFYNLDSAAKENLAVDYVIEGSKLQQKGQFAESILEFQQALRYDSASSIHYAIAESYKELGKFNLAEEFAKKSLRKDSVFIPSMEILTEIYIVKKEVPKALTIYRQILKLDSSFERKYNYAILQEYQNPSQAVDLYEDLVSKRDEPEILYRLANLYKKLDREKDRIKILKKLTDYSERDFSASDDLIKIYLDKGDYEESFKLIDKFKASNPKEETAYFLSLTGNKLLEDSSKKAENLITEFLDIVNGNFKSNWRLNMISGYLSDKVGDSSRRDNYFDYALKADTLTAIPLAIANYYMSEEEYLSALEILKEREPKHPDRYEFPLYQGWMYLEVDSLNKASGAFLKALRLDSNNVDVWSQLGLIYDRMSKYDSSDYAYERALEINPEDPLINNNYAYSLAERDTCLKKAMEMISLAIEKEPENASYLDTYGWIHYKLGNYDKALEHIKKAVEIGGNKAEALEHLGCIYLKFENKEKALKAFEESVEINPDNEALWKKIKKMKESQK